MTEELMKHGEIQSFDHEGGPDWALAPPKTSEFLHLTKEEFKEKKMTNDNWDKEKTLEALYHRWAYANMCLEIKINEGGRMTTDPDERWIKDYCLSTINRQRFVQYIQRAAYEKAGLTIRELVKLVGCSRGAVETMIKELENAKLLEKTTNKKGIFTHKGTDKLLNYHLNYSKWLFRACFQVGIRQTATAINEIEGLNENKDVELLRI